MRLEKGVRINVRDLGWASGFPGNRNWFKDATDTDVLLGIPKEESRDSINNSTDQLSTDGTSPSSEIDASGTEDDTLLSRKRQRVE